MEQRRPRIYLFSEEQLRGESYASTTYNCFVLKIDERGKHGDVIDKISVGRHHLFAGVLKARNLLPDLDLDVLESVERRRIVHGKYQGPVSEDEFNEIYQDLRKASQP